MLSGLPRKLLLLVLAWAESRVPTLYLRQRCNRLIAVCFILLVSEEKKRKHSTLPLLFFYSLLVQLP